MLDSQTRFIVITGGVISSLGKGLSSASLALLLKRRGLKIRQLKMDPYINVDPGTMSPFQHGEVFVTEDGAETDLDLGHYERFTDENVYRNQNITTGQIYERVIAKERRGDYLGGTVQVIPHVTQEIKDHIFKLAKGVDVLLIEIGGTVGDIESLPFLEAVRQLRFDVGPDHITYVHLTLVPYIAAAGELKTKPTQHSVQELRRIGIQPDFLLCRAERPLSAELRAKIGLFANLPKDHVVPAPDVETIYQLPLTFSRESLDKRICEQLKLKSRSAELDDWKQLVDTIQHPSGLVRIGIVGKYTDLKESYKSLHEALGHAAAAQDVCVDLKYIDAESLESDAYKDVLARRELFEDCHGILVPGGFGARGVEGKIRAIEYARSRRVPFFGICLGMQLMAIEFARNVAGLPKAHSGEFRKSGDLVVDYMSGQKSSAKGGTMRLGAYRCSLEPGTRASKAYKSRMITERHRHRLEFQNRYRKRLESKGLKVSGVNPDSGLVEILELSDHPWFLGCQFHPEFKSRPVRAHPLFHAFIQASRFVIPMDFD